MSVLGQTDATSVEQVLTNVVEFLPRLLAFLIILAVGWFVARALQRVISAVLTRVGFDRAVERGGIRRAMARTEYEASDVVARVVFYALLLFVLQLAFSVFGPNAISDLITDVIAYLPRLFVAIVIVVVAAAIAAAVRELIDVTIGGLEYGRLLANATAVVIVGIGVFAALSQLRIAPAIVNGLFYALLAIIVGVTVVAVGGGGIAPMRQRWERALTRLDEESARVRDEVASTSREDIAERVRQRREQVQPADARRSTAGEGSPAATTRAQSRPDDIRVDVDRAGHVTTVPDDRSPGERQEARRSVPPVAAGIDDETVAVDRPGEQPTGAVAAEAVRHDTGPGGDERAAEVGVDERAAAAGPDEREAAAGPDEREATSPRTPGAVSAPPPPVDPALGETQVTPRAPAWGRPVEPAAGEPPAPEERERGSAQEEEPPPPVQPELGATQPVARDDEPGATQRIAQDDALVLGAPAEDAPVEDAPDDDPDRTQVLFVDRDDTQQIAGPPQDTARRSSRERGSRRRGNRKPRPDGEGR
jgi:hypothetical protein